MACECNATVGANLIAHQIEKYPNRKYEKDDWDLGFLNEAYFPTLGYILPYFQYRTRYTQTKVNGDESKPKTDIVSIYPSFCPFCGKNYDEEEVNFKG